jgi:hypothetical protein
VLHPRPGIGDHPQFGVKLLERADG